MEKIRKNNRLLFNFTSFSKIKKIILKNYFLKRKSLSIFKKNGEFTIKKNEINFLNFLNKISKSKKKWRTYLFKKQYIKKFQYKKNKKRIKNYIQKNILSRQALNYYNIYKIFNTNLLSKNLSSFNVYYFEFLNLKLRFLEKHLKRI